MNEAITFSDVLIVPKFSHVESRKDVNLSVDRLGLNLTLPVISANMDTISDSKMCIAMAKQGAVGCLHRFMDIETNVNEFRNIFLDAGHQTMVSIGLGLNELERAEALVDAGACSIVVDVANGASMSVVKQVKELRKLFPNIFITVGNFATRESVRTFLTHEGRIDGVKVGVGPGSRCLTRVITGCGYPQFSALLEISREIGHGMMTIIADGGMNSVGDVAKALGTGAHLVMSGSFFAGTEESPGETVWKCRDGKYYTKEYVSPMRLDHNGDTVLDEDSAIDLPCFKKYRGSASKESYEVQGKTAKHRSPEGDSTYISYKGPVSDVLQEIEGGLRSAFTYTDSKTLEEFHTNVEFVRVSSNTVIENGTRNGAK